MAKVAFDGKRELRWLQEGGCFIAYFQADVEFADALWDQWLSAIIHAPGTKVLLSSWGDILPSKEQWRKATKTLRGCGKTFAFVTDSKATSALVKAASWGGVDIQAFRWEQLYDASVHIGLEREQRISIRATLTALRDSFGAVNSDGELGSTVGKPVFGGSSAFAASRASQDDRSHDDRPKPRPPAPSRPLASVSATPSQRPPATPSRSEPERSRTPMADAASRNLEQVRQTSEEIQAKLAEIQARLRSRRTVKG